MNDNGKRRGRFICVDVTHVTADGPGNRTPGPRPPSARAALEAFRDKLIRYGRLKLPEQPKEGDQPDQSEPK